MYKMQWRSLFSILSFLPFTTTAQEIKGDHLYNAINKDAFARITYENDLFAGTDRYYTQGIYATVVFPALEKLPVYWLTIRPKNNRIVHGLAVQHNAFTPTSVSDTSLRTGDQPYASSLTLQLYSIATNADRKQRITSTITAGIIGRAAGGEWLQKNIHKLTDNYEPRGWHHQVANDVALNYGVYYERNLLSVGKIAAINGTGNVNAGTLNTSAGIGAQLMLGYFKPLFSDADLSSKFSFNIYAHPQVVLVGYNGHLQGGLLSKSEYTVPASGINRLLILNKYGVVMNFGKLLVEYYYNYSTPTFKNAGSHTAGGICASFPL